MAEYAGRNHLRGTYYVIGIYAASDLFYENHLMYRKDELIRMVRGRRRRIRRELRKLSTVDYYIKEYGEKEASATVLDGVLLLTDRLIRL